MPKNNPHNSCVTCWSKGLHTTVRPDGTCPKCNPKVPPGIPKNHICWTTDDFEYGQRVEVMSGPLVGLQGTVVDKDAYLVEVHFAEAPFMQQYEDSRKGRGHFQPQDLRDVPAPRHGPVLHI